MGALGYKQRWWARIWVILLCKPKMKLPFKFSKQRYLFFFCFCFCFSFLLPFGRKGYWSICQSPKRRASLITLTSMKLWEDTNCPLFSDGWSGNISPISLSNFVRMAHSLHYFCHAQHNLEGHKVPCYVDIILIAGWG